MAAMRTRITELPNELTSNIDAADAVGIVRLLRQSDAQLFVGWGAHPSINDGKILEKINHVANKAAMLLNENHLHGTKNTIVFSGSGTSGRIAWLCSRAYNRLLCQAGREPCFRYLISGGDESLIISNELPEDDPPLGAKDLKSLTTGVQEVMFFGITCGLSAPYVAGQVDYAMHQPNYTTVLVGFNPVTLARDTPIEKWHKTCRETFLELEQLSWKSDRAVVLNPVVGPEPITGSTRMKGGSMTAILLDTIFITALSRAFSIPMEQFIQAAAPVAGGIGGLINSDTMPVNSCADTKVEPLEGNTSDLSQGGGSKFQHSLSRECQEVAGIVDTFAAAYCSAYRPAEGVAALLNLAASCLRHSDGHLYYIGASTFGILGLIDSSEMVDTYGAALDEVRGFVLGGWKTCGNQEGDIYDKGRLFHISTSHFETELLSNLTNHDAVVCLCSPEESSQLQAIMEKVLSTPAKCGLLVLSGQNNSRDAQPEHFHSILDRRYQTTVLVSLPHFKVCGKEPLFGGFALKLIVNAISTGANVLKGRVYGNTMINLTVANDKLFYRSVDIICELSEAAEEEARAALLRAIYRDDNAEKYTTQPVSSHIRAATRQNMVIPLAVVLASGQSRTVADALELITDAHSLRTIIKP